MITALCVNNAFINQGIINKILQQAMNEPWVSTVPDGPYATDAWRVIKLVDKNVKLPALDHFPEIVQILSFFQCNVINMVLYSILPGGELHPHRDLTGTLELGKLRFHVPLITDSKVEFYVGGKNHRMKPGELWALNTSHRHSVANKSNIDRIHLVLMVDTNPWVYSLLPKLTIGDSMHRIYFYGLIIVVGISTIFQPKKLKGRFHVFKNFLKVLLNKRNIN